MAEILQFVGFRVGAQRFAVEIHSVREVISLCRITPVPGASPFYAGMIDLRGKPVPVFDMRKRLGVEIQNVMQTRILIVRSTRQEVGLIVDAADQVYTISSDEIHPPPEGSSNFVLAVATHDNSLLLILDLDRLVSGNRALNHSERQPQT